MMFTHTISNGKPDKEEKSLTDLSRRKPDSELVAEAPPAKRSKSSPTDETLAAGTFAYGDYFISDLPNHLTDTKMEDIETAPSTTQKPLEGFASKNLPKHIVIYYNATLRETLENIPPDITTIYLQDGIPNHYLAFLPKHVKTLCFALSLDGKFEKNIPAHIEEVIITGGIESNSLAHIQAPHLHYSHQVAVSDITSKIDERLGKNLKAHILKAQTLYKEMKWNACIQEIKNVLPIVNINNSDNLLRFRYAYTELMARTYGMLKNLEIHIQYFLDTLKMIELIKNHLLPDVETEITIHFELAFIYLTLDQLQKAEEHIQLGSYELDEKFNNSKLKLDLHLLLGNVFKQQQKKWEGTEEFIKAALLAQKIFKNDPINKMLYGRIQLDLSSKKQEMLSYDQTQSPLKIKLLKEQIDHLEKEIKACEEKFTEQYTCPISLELIKEAVILPDGHAYDLDEAKKILGDLKEASCPQNQAKKFTKDDLKPHQKITQLIVAHRAEIKKSQEMVITKKNQLLELERKEQTNINEKQRLQARYALFAPLNSTHWTLMYASLPLEEKYQIPFRFEYPFQTFANPSYLTNALATLNQLTKNTILQKLYNFYGLLYSHSYFENFILDEKNYLACVENNRPLPQKNAYELSLQAKKYITTLIMYTDWIQHNNSGILTLSLFNLVIARDKILLNNIEKLFVETEAFINNLNKNEKSEKFRQLIRTKGIKWPHSPLLKNDIEAAGFEFKPTLMRRDRCICKSCGLEKFSWQAWDNPWLDHDLTKHTKDFKVYVKYKGSQYANHFSPEIIPFGLSIKTPLAVTIQDLPITPNLRR